MGNESIDLGLSNIYRSWFAYRKGKKASQNFDYFQYNLHEELQKLNRELNNNTYRHGNYRKFTVTDNKKREISVASIRDRVVHRLLYDYIVEIFDQIFIFDAWSCRKGKGLTGCINKTQKFIKKYPNGFVWRADIQKFFDSVDHNILYKRLEGKISDGKALSILRQIIDSFEIKSGIGIPIGNLTSQIFSNIYLNELDRFVKHEMKCKAYLRYGDDFIIFHRDKKILLQIKDKTSDFIENTLNLKIHLKNNLIIKAEHGLKFLGVVMYPKGRELTKRNQTRIHSRVNFCNSGSYWGVMSQHTSPDKLKSFQWDLVAILLDNIAPS